MLANNSQDHQTTPLDTNIPDRATDFCSDSSVSFLMRHNEKLTAIKNTSSSIHLNGQVLSVLQPFRKKRATKKQKLGNHIS